jgi:methanogenic corrinoid protein MtbC1
MKRPPDHALAHEFERALLTLDRAAASRLLQRTGPDADALGVIETAVVPALERIGTAWEEGSIALSQYYMCGRICEEVVLGSLPTAETPEPAPAPVAIVTLEDRHELGRRIVVAALASSGLAVRDLGCRTVDELVPELAADPPRVLLVSTLLLRSALKVAELRARLAVAGLRIPVAVGGSPFRLDPELWREVGADATGRSALDAVEAARALLARDG